MFDFIADGLTILLSVLFPIYASYKALSTSDPALLHPWLIYWVCLAILTTATSILSPILQFVPFLAWLRLSAHLYLLLPGEQQGAAYIYQTQVEPWLHAHDADIEQLISTGHDRVKAMGMLYFKRAVAFVKAQLLGQADTSTTSTSSPSPSSSSIHSTPPRPRTTAFQQQQQQSPGQTYASSLLARFSLSSARPAAVASATSAAVGGSADASSRDAALFGLLSSALQAATAAGVISGGGGGAGFGSGTGASSGANVTTPPRAAAASGSAGAGGADAAKYAEGLAALLSAFTKQAGQAGTSADGAGAGAGGGPKEVPNRTTSPPVGFEAIEHEDAKLPVPDESGVGSQQRPQASKRRSTSGGWGGWWAGKKEREGTKDKVEGIKEGIGESGEKSESRRVSGVKSD